MQTEVDKYERPAKGMRRDLTVSDQLQETMDSLIVVEYKWSYLVVQISLKCLSN